MDRDHSLEDQPTLNLVAYMASLLTKFKPGIIAALEYAQGSHTFDDVCQRVFQGMCTFWHLNDTFVITEIVDAPRKRTLHVFLAAGDRSDLVSLHPRIIKYAREQGCVAVTLTGRSGWIKVLEHIGWQEVHRTLMLDISTPLPIESDAQIRAMDEQLELL